MPFISPHVDESFSSNIAPGRTEHLEHRLASLSVGGISPRAAIAAIHQEEKF